MLIFVKDPGEKEPAEGKTEALDELLHQMESVIEDFQDRAFSVGVVYLSPDARDSTNNAQEEKSQEIIKEAINREKLLRRLRTRVFGFDLSEQDNQVTVVRVVPKSPAAEAGLKPDDRILEAKGEVRGEEDGKYEEVRFANDIVRQAATVSFGKNLTLKIEREQKKHEVTMKLRNVISACYPAEGPKGFNINPKAEITILFLERFKVLENYSYPPDGMQMKDVKMIVDRVRTELPLRKKKTPEKVQKG